MDLLFPVSLTLCYLGVYRRSYSLCPAFAIQRHHKEFVGLLSFVLPFYFFPRLKS